MNYDQTAIRSTAIAALTTAVQHEHDFAGWLADALAAVAARHGSSYALIAGRPGSWEASLVTQLVRGTIGWDDEHLDPVFAHGISLREPAGPADVDLEEVE